MPPQQILGIVYVLGDMALENFGIQTGTIASGDAASGTVSMMTTT